jgi:hypothetical protein
MFSDDELELSLDCLFSSSAITFAPLGSGCVDCISDEAALSAAPGEN